MKILPRLILFAMLLVVVSCADTASDKKAKNVNTRSATENKTSTEEVLTKDSETEKESDSVNYDSTKVETTSPDQLIEQLYKQHDNENSPFFQDKDRALVDKFFVKTLADMIWKDSVESKGEIGALEFDPLYSAQDTEIAEFKVGKPEIKGEKATVAVTFLNFGEEQKLKYLLAEEKEMWKIENIDYGETTLIKLYRENNSGSQKKSESKN